MFIGFVEFSVFPLWERQFPSVDCGEEVISIELLDETLKMLHDYLVILLIEMEA